ncbi:MAG: tetratricopeptide repeat protein [Dehalococcoidia bacterium]
MTNLDSALAGWYIPGLPAELRSPTTQKLDLEAVGFLIGQKLAEAHNAEDTSGIQIVISDWLYDLVRSNVKRGRVFELDDVLSTGRADCLGYTKLFSAIGPRFSLELGIVEVLIDNAGRYVPHHVNLLNLVNGAYRFIDAWYGSSNIRHRRIGALVDGVTRDINEEELSGIQDIRGLPDHCIDAITLYIEGNRFLQRDELDEAIKCYSEAIELYSNNSRAFYNRALAHDRKGNTEEAKLDYAQALKDESSLIRVLATIEELEDLIKLDEKGIGKLEQDIYLWHKGFKTGEQAGYEEIGRRYKISPEEVKSIVSRVESLCIR